MQLSPSQRAGLNGGARSRDIMRHRGETFTGHKLWDDAELTLLRSRPDDRPWLARMLPHRTTGAIANRLGKMGLLRSRRVWSPAQERAAKPPYVEGEPAAEIGQRVEKTKQQVWGKASHRRYRRPRKPPALTGVPLLDKVRRRAFDLHFTMTELDAEARGRGYFKWGRGLNYRALARAVKLLDGRLVVRWPPQ